MVPVFVGIVILVVVLAGIAFAFGVFGRSKYEFALGLPPGSIRAVLALGLLLAFVGLSTFLFLNLATIEPVTISENVQAEPTGLPNDVFALKVDDTHWNVYSVRGQNAVADLAQQIFTTVATVLVTVIGFYFGTRGTQPQTTQPSGNAAAPTTPADRAKKASVEAAEAVKQAKSALDRVRRAVGQLKAKVQTLDGFKKKLGEAEVKRAGTLVTKTADEMLKVQEAARVAAEQVEKVPATKSTKAAAQLAEATEKARDDATAAANRATAHAEAAEQALKRLTG